MKNRLKHCRFKVNLNAIIGFSVLCIGLVFLSCKNGSAANSACSENEAQVIKEFVLVPVPEGGIYFPAGIDDEGGGKKDAYGNPVKEWFVEEPFEIGLYEVTYELWAEIYGWALQNGYRFLNAGKAGSDGALPSKGDPGGSPIPAPLEERTKKHPVVNICWYDAAVWCNAYSEKSGKVPCYYYGGHIYKNAAQTFEEAGETIYCGDRIQYNKENNGYRLPLSAEWELSARWLGNSASGFSVSHTQKDGNFYRFTKGCAMSGSSVPALNEEAGKADDEAFHLSIKEVNDLFAVYGSFWNGKTYKRKKELKSAEIGSKKANTLGIFDMSGNAAEWCFDWEEGNEYKIFRGGNYHDLARALQIGLTDKDKPFAKHLGTGFRLAKNEDAGF